MKHILHSIHVLPPFDRDASTIIGVVSACGVNGHVRDLTVFIAYPFFLKLDAREICPRCTGAYVQNQLGPA